MGYLVYTEELKCRYWAFGNPFKALQKEKQLVDLGYTVHVIKLGA